MQNLLLGGELLPEVIDSLVFFEQAQWFVETLSDEQPRVPTQELARHASKIVGALKKMSITNSCSFVVSGNPPWQHIWSQVADPVKRLATVALAVSHQSRVSDDAWLTAKMSELVLNLETGKLSPSSFVGPIKSLDNLGCLASEEGKHLVAVLKRRALSNPSDLDDFETLAELVSALPLSFAETELDTVRGAYSEFADGYAADCDIRNPDELREEASRLGNVSSLLEVDTEAAQDRLRESADDIESEQESRLDEDDERDGGGSDPELCSDRELDGMFGTLGS